VTGDVALFVEDDVMQNSSLEGIAQHYKLLRIEIAGIMLDPARPVDA